MQRGGEGGRAPAPQIGVTAAAADADAVTCCNPYCKDPTMERLNADLEKWRRSKKKTGKPDVRFKGIQEGLNTSAGVWVNYFAGKEQREQPHAKFKVTSRHSFCMACYNAWDRFAKCRKNQEDTIMSVCILSDKKEDESTKHQYRRVFDEAGVALADELFNGPYPSSMRTFDTLRERYFQIAESLFARGNHDATPVKRTFLNNFERIVTIFKAADVKFNVTGTVPREEERDGRKPDDKFIMPFIGSQQDASLASSIVIHMHNASTNLSKKERELNIRVEQLEAKLKEVEAQKDRLEQERAGVEIYRDVHIGNMHDRLHCTSTPYMRVL
jgi:hypothetical protein